mgnify:CR=1 FL=1
MDKARTELEAFVAAHKLCGHPMFKFCEYLQFSIPPVELACPMLLKQFPAPKPALANPS